MPATAPDRDKEHLAATIRRICRERGWTQADFARHAQIGPDVVSVWVNRRSMAALPTLKRVASNLGMSADEFLAPEEPAQIVTAPAPTPAPVKSDNAVRLEMDPSRPAFARIEIRASIPSDAALRIIQILNESTGQRGT